MPPFFYWGGTSCVLLCSNAMRYALWLAAPVVFLFFVTLAVKNLDPVIVRYFLG